MARGRSTAGRKSASSARGKASTASTKQSQGSKGRTSTGKSYSTENE